MTELTRRSVNANAIPAAMWMLLGILQDENLTSRVMEEAQPTFQPGSLHFNINQLCSGNLLNSIYLETLRIRVAAPVGRTSLVPNLNIGEFHLKQGVTMLSTSWVGGRDPDFWNTGASLEDGSEEHPVDAFWAERFLQYNEDPSSGPIRSEGSRNMSRMDASRKKTPEDDRNAKLVTDGMQAYWYPYGGGTKMCPGRFFAKQELMAGVAVFLRAYEVQLVDPAAAAKVGPNMAYFPFGTIPPKEKVAVRIRRRRLS